MKRKGFTLIELLAVIVILAVISLITVPMITSVIEESKKKALVSSVQGVLDATDYFTMSHDAGVYEFLFDREHQGSTKNGENLDYKGKIEGEGKIYLDKEGNTSICISNDKYYVYKNYNSEIMIGERNKDNCNIEYDALTNKYVAFLESKGSGSNVYSKDEIDNLVDGLDTKITSNTNEINNLKSNIIELQNNLNNNLIQYNSDNDSLDIYKDGMVIGSIPCGFQTFKFANTKGSDWVVSNNITVVPDGNNITFKPVNLASGGGWSARYTKKITVKTGAQFYYAVNSTQLHFSGNLQYSSDGTNWTSFRAFNSGSGGSGSVILPAGDYYFMFSGWSNANPSNSVFTVMEIK